MNKSHGKPGTNNYCNEINKGEDTYTETLPGPNVGQKLKSSEQQQESTSTLPNKYPFQDFQQWAAPPKHGSCSVATNSIWPEYQEPDGVSALNSRGPLRLWGDSVLTSATCTRRSCFRNNMALQGVFRFPQAKSDPELMSRSKRTRPAVSLTVPWWFFQVDPQLVGPHFDQLHPSEGQRLQGLQERRAGQLHGR